ncbi:hypothetical protein Baya_0137 [Bagarius yarrelli]|uniref:Uncharacterized protein n=1 Tax=Bagarius yarrelli TaxID=175774 RepID=A0A556THD5_BAGYA|nr:hypothetical protein Baya_0137 [Bagarius yarrelli]
MGITDKNTVMEEAANWPADVHFPKINRRGTRRSQSSLREVSPVPSHYSEPVSLRKRKDVTARLPCLINEADQQEDENDDIQSLKSLPTVMNTLISVPKGNRSHTSRKGQSVSDFSLPFLGTSKCTLMVKDKVEMSSAYHPLPVGPPQYAPLGKSRPHEKSWNIKASRQHLHASVSNKVSLGPSVQGVYPIKPAVMKEAYQPLRPVLMREEALNRGALHCLLEEHYLPISNNPHLLEPFSGFEEHLRHQLLNSPLPCHAALPHINSHPLFQLDAVLPVPQGVCSSLMQRTVELCNPQRKQFPSITMTRPTPSPKHLSNTENRDVA